jgi:RNA polymerase sigma-70 factor (ECF subfamily)
MHSDLELVDGLRAGDEAAFAELVERYHERLIGLARRFVSNRESAEDVVQETWLAVLRGIERFEGRAQLRTWLFQICVNRARSQGVRERRTVPVGPGDPVADGRLAQHGASAEPERWIDLVDDRVAAGGVAELVGAAIERLPGPQKQVVTMRDLEGRTSREVCVVLDISESNQRVLLHRGRSAVRRTVTARRRLHGGAAGDQCC